MNSFSLSYDEENFARLLLCILYFQQLRNRLKTCTVIKKRLQHRCFPVNFAKPLRTLVLQNNLRVTASVFSLNYFPGFPFLFRPLLSLSLVIVEHFKIFLWIWWLLGDKTINQKIQKQYPQKISAETSIIVRFVTILGWSILKLYSTVKASLNNDLKRMISQ